MCEILSYEFYKPISPFFMQNFFLNKIINSINLSGLCAPAVISESDALPAKPIFNIFKRYNKIKKKIKKKTNLFNPK